LKLSTTPSPLSRRSPLALFLCPLFVGCVVPQNRYDDAVTRLKGEQAAHQADAADLGRSKAELARLNQTLGGREQSLAAREGELSQAKLDSYRVSTERDDAVVLVEQLRGELARVGSNLLEFSEQKRELQAALTEADTRAKRLDQAEKSVEAKVLLVRDVSLALGDAVTKGTVSVTVVDGKPAVRLDAREVFSEKSSELLPGSASVFERLGAMLAERKGTRVELGDRSTDSGSPEDRIIRLQRVAGVLSEKGLGLDRIGFAVAPPGAAAPSTEPTLAPPPAAAPVAKAKAPGSWREGPGSIEIVIDVDAPS
jgi:flagellar motor protein MotB